MVNEILTQKEKTKQTKVLVNFEYGIDSKNNSWAGFSNAELIKIVSHCVSILGIEKMLSHKKTLSVNFGHSIQFVLSYPEESITYPMTLGHCYFYSEGDESDSLQNCTIIINNGRIVAQTAERENKIGNDNKYIVFRITNPQYYVYWVIMEELSHAKFYFGHTDAEVEELKKALLAKNKNKKLSLKSTEPEEMIANLDCAKFLMRQMILRGDFKNYAILLGCLIKQKLTGQAITISVREIEDQLWVE